MNSVDCYRLPPDPRRRPGRLALTTARSGATAFHCETSRSIVRPTVPSRIQLGMVRAFSAQRPRD